MECRSSPTLDRRHGARVMAAILADPGLARGAHRSHRRSSLPNAPSTASTSTTRTSPSRTDKDTWESTRPDWVRSSRSWAARLHADGRVLTGERSARLRRRAERGQWLLGLRLRRDRSARRRRSASWRTTTRPISLARSRHLIGSTRSSPAPPMPPAAPRSWCSASRCTGATGSIATTRDCPLGGGPCQEPPPERHPNSSSAATPSRSTTRKPASGRSRTR